MRVELQWFLDRLGCEVLRNGRPILVCDALWAEHLYSIQGELYSYTDPRELAPCSLCGIIDTRKEN